MSREIIKLGMTPCPGPESFDYARNKTECFHIVDQGGLPTGRERRRVCALATRGPSTSTTLRG